MRIMGIGGTGANVIQHMIGAGFAEMDLAMLNTDVIQPTGKLIPKVMRVKIRFGPAIDFAKRYPGKLGDRMVERAITDEIMYELMTLTGREYVDVYAATLKTAVVTPTPVRADQTVN